MNELVVIRVFPNFTEFIPYWFEANEFRWRWQYHQIIDRGQTVAHFYNCSIHYNCRRRLRIGIHHTGAVSLAVNREDHNERGLNPQPVMDFDEEDDAHLEIDVPNLWLPEFIVGLAMLFLEKNALPTKQDLQEERNREDLKKGIEDFDKNSNLRHVEAEEKIVLPTTQDIITEKTPKLAAEFDKSGLRHVWIVGSILALSTFQKMWINKQNEITI
ncbi:hypothetical protein ACQ4LE_001095 [Meloidogyne hapla]